MPNPTLLNNSRMRQIKLKPDSLVKIIQQHFSKYFRTSNF